MSRMPMLHCNFVGDNECPVGSAVITISKMPMTGEDGTDDEIKVALTVIPDNLVTVWVTSSDLSEAVVSPMSLVFDEINWRSGVTVTVTGIDDEVDDGDINYEIRLSTRAIPDDLHYAAVLTASTTGTNSDDDMAGLSVPPGRLATSEAGATARFPVSLSSEPTGLVTVSVSSSDAGEATAAPPSLVFDADSWDTALTVTVTGVDDEIDDGDVAYEIDLSVSAAPAGSPYAGLTADVAGTNSDDSDMAGLSVPPGRLTTSEAGATARFTVSLSSEPTGPVTVTVSSSDAGEATAAPPSLVFDADSWDTALTVTVTGVDDEIDDGDADYEIDLSVSASPAGSPYAGLTADVAGTNSDDDMAGLSVPPGRLATSEAGGTARFTVSLASEPTGPVTVSVSSSDAGEATAAPSLLVFNAGSWDTALTVTVTGIDDKIDDGDVDYGIRLSVSAAPAGSPYKRMLITVLGTNSDDDTGELLVPSTSFLTDEDGGQGVFAVSLSSNPFGMVTVSVTSGDLTEGIPTLPTLVFSPSNWNVGLSVTVLGQDDTIADGDTKYKISLSVSGVDEGSVYTGSTAIVTGINAENETIEIITSPDFVRTGEGGVNAMITVKLSSKPRGAVYVQVDSSNDAEARVSQTLRFRKATWNIGQTLEVLGVDDNVADGVIGYEIFLIAQASKRNPYRNVRTTVLGSNADDELAELVIDSSSIATGEDGATDSFKVSLSSEPTGLVTVSVSSSDAGEATASPPSLVFDADSWETALTVTVTGVDDEIDDGDVAYEIELSVSAAPAGSPYVGLTAEVAGTNSDDSDMAGLSVPPGRLATSEAGATARFTVSLSSEPTGLVTVSVSSSDAGEATATPPSLVFDADSWDTALTVTVTGVDDEIDDGSVAYEIELSVSAAPAGSPYAGLTAEVAGTNSDDSDMAGLSVPPGRLATSEAGATARFTVSLSSEPIGLVTVSVSSSDAGEATAAPSSLVFDADSWDTALTVTVTGVDDEIDDGNVAYEIKLSVSAAPAGSPYVGLTADVAGTNSDDSDMAGLSVPPGRLATSEAGATARFTVSLSSEPIGLVTVSVSSSDAGEATAAPSSLVFDADSWDTALTVTVTGVDDEIDDGSVAYEIELSVSAAPAGSPYAGLTADVAGTNSDDSDMAGLSVPPGRLATSEAGATARFTVSLASEPTGLVTVSVSSSDAGEATAAPSSLVFDADSWDTALTVTVTGVDDEIDDGSVAYEIELSVSAAPAGSPYVGLTADVAGTNSDDSDMAGLSVPPGRLATSEAGATARFTVSLSSEPTGPVTVSVSSSDAGEATAAPSSLVFGADSWDTALTVTVTGVDDEIDDGSVAYEIELSVSAAPAGSPYVGLTADVAGTNSDDSDMAGLSVPPGRLATSEAGATARFTVSLASEPTGLVTVSVSSSDAGEATAAPSSLVFDADSWDTALTVTVTGVDDEIDDGSVAYEIELSVSAAPAGSPYAGLTADVAGTNSDDSDMAGLSVPPGRLATSEAGATARFTVSLSSEPTGLVTVSVSSSDAGEATAAPSSLVFGADSWDTALTVTVTGVDDEIDDGSVAYEIELSVSAAPAGSPYVGLTAEVAGTNSDDSDMAGLSVPPGRLATSEAGATARFTVSLASEPTGLVTVSVSSSDAGEATAAPSSLVFDADSWDTALTVTVTGVDDEIDDGSVAYEIELSVSAAPAGSPYAGLTAEVAGTNSDDSDMAGLSVPPGRLATSEAGATARFTVSLSSEPTGLVTVSVSSSDAGEATAAPSSLVFDADSWDTALTVTVTGVDDEIDDGSVAYEIELSVSAAPAGSPYVGLTADVAGTNSDDSDMAGLSVPPGRLATSEAGATARFTVSLSSEPTGPVTVSVSSSDAGEATAAPSSLVFGADSWDTALTVTVTGVDDEIDDGSVAYEIELSVSAAPAGSPYAGLTADVAGTNSDDSDMAGLSVPPGRLATSEAGATARFTVSLSSEPTGLVTVSVSSSDAGEATATPPSLVFDADSWDTALTVTVTGVDDEIDDGSVAYEIELSVSAAPAGSPYAGLTAEVAGTNSDDSDMAGLSVPPGRLATSEAGATARFTVSLSSEPIGLVTVSVSSSDAGEATAAPSSLVFDADSWDTALTVTVTGVDDEIDDGNVAYEIKLSVSAAPAGSPYVGLTADVAGTNSDDSDMAGLSVPPGRLATSEAGATARFTVSLSSEPIGLVTVSVSSSDAGEATAAPSSLVFDADSWDTALTVTVTGVDDEIDDGSVAYEIELSVSAAPAGSPYAGLTADVAGTNSDDSDMAGLSVPPGRLATSEAGATARFTVSLASEPTGLVTVSVSSSDAGEATAAPSSLVFDADSWDTALTVTVTGVDDEIDDGSVAYEIELSVSAAPAGSPYVGLTADVAGTNSDDSDMAGLSVPPGRLATSEAGATARFTVSLSSEPTGPVTVSVSSSDAGEATAAPSSLVFGADSWDTALTVTVTGVDDEIDDGSVAYEIELSVSAAPAGSPYVGLTADVAGTNSDDSDMAGLSVPPGRLATSEAGATARFTVSLASEPTGLVTVSVSSSDAGEATAAPSSLVFDADSWDTALTVTVTGVDDEIDDGSVAYEIELSVSAAPAGSPYAGLTADVAGTNSDDSDMAGLSVPPGRLATSEAGATARFTVSLSSEPTGLVTVSVSSSDAGEATAAPSSLVFGADSWDTALTVTVTGVDDEIDDGSVAYEIELSVSAAPAGSPYVGLTADVAGTNSDDSDMAGLSVPPGRLATSEAGATARFTVSLSSEPIGLVTVSVSSSDAGEATAAPSSLVFDADSWDTALTVTVTGVDDEIDDGSVAYEIELSVSAAPAGSPYAGLTADVAGTNSDDSDMAGLSVPPGRLATSEAGATARFTVSLASEPTGLVTVSVSSSDAGEATAAPSSLVFDADSWDTALTVTVTGVDDEIDDGSVAYEIELSVSAAPAGSPYVGLTADVAGTNSDDSDMAGLSVPPGRLATSEAGATARFTVSLSSEPTGPVTVSVSSSDAGEATAAPSSLVFDADSWETALTVTVTGVDDEIDDGDVAYEIELSVSAAPAGSPYAGLTADVAGTNSDDSDMAGLSVPPGRLATSEAGATARFTVSLASEPTGLVTVSVSSSDAGEATAAPSSLVFDADSWDTALTVTVTGVDDEIDDGSVAYEIELSVSAAPAGSPYAGLTAEVAGTNSDDSDMAGLSVPPGRLATSEAGATARFTVSLSSEPTGLVTVSVSSSDAGEATAAPSSLVFGADSWDTALTVTVTGVDDEIDDGSVAYEIELSVSAAPAGSPYVGLTADVAGTNSDDSDMAGLSVPPGRLATSEAGATARFTVSLSSEPTGPVTVSVSSSDAGEATAAPSSLVFDADSWETALTVTVTGVDDEIDDGDVAYEIELSVSAAPAGSPYAGLTADVAGTNSDDSDMAGLSVPPGRLATSEAGATARFTVSLSSEPTGLVTVSVSSSDAGEATATPPSLVFDADSWDTALTVTVTGVDDEIDDGSVAYEIELSVSAAPAGSPYAGLTAEVAGTNSDDSDMAGLSVPPGRLATSEAGATARFTVSLSSEPIGLVTVSVSSSDAGEATAAPSSLVFDADSWDTALTVTVTGVDDEIDDGNVAYEIKLSVSAAPAGSPYVGLTADVAGTNSDDSDMAGLSVPPGRLATSEAGATARFTVSLASEPTGLVTVSVSSSDAGEATAAPSSLVFDADSWDTALTVTVTGVDDEIDDGSVAYEIELSVSAAPAGSPYVGLTADVAGTNSDDSDMAGLSVPPGRLATSEAGATARFTVSLSSEPTGLVTVSVSSSDAGEATAAPSSLVFGIGTWDTAQTVTVTGVDDEIDDGSVAYEIELSVSAAPAGSPYAGLTADVAGTNSDDSDMAGLSVPPGRLATSEAGATARFTVSLSSEPAGPVTVSVSSSDAGEATAAPPSLVFGVGTWDTAQTVTVTGVDDEIDDGDVAYEIELSVSAAPAGSPYAGLTAEVAGTNSDDSDMAGLSVPPGRLATSEAGATARFTVSLASKPAGPVTVSVSSSDAGEATAAPPSLVFGVGTWDTAQTVTVTGVDDEIDDGAVAYEIELSVSAAPAGSPYAGLTADVAGTNSDDSDMAGLSVPPGRLATSEAGATARFTVSLSSKPAGPVTVSVSSSDAGEATAAPPSLVFDVGTWGTAQTVTVTGVDDEIDDGDVDYEIELSVSAAPAGSPYAGLMAYMAGINSDDDDGQQDMGQALEAVLSLLGQHGVSGSLVSKIHSRFDADRIDRIHVSLDGHSLLNENLGSWESTDDPWNRNEQGGDRDEMRRILHSAELSLPLPKSSPTAYQTEVWAAAGLADFQGDSNLPGSARQRLKYDGKSSSIYLGVDLNLSDEILAGVSVAHTETSLNCIGIGFRRIDYDMLSVHPYMAWDRGKLRSWTLLGLGRGDYVAELHDDGGRVHGKTWLFMADFGVERHWDADGYELATGLEGFFSRTKLDDMRIGSAMFSDVDTEVLLGKMHFKVGRRFDQSWGQINPHGVAEVRRVESYFGGLQALDLGIDLDLKANAGLQAQMSARLQVNDAEHEENRYSALLTYDQDADRRGLLFETGHGLSYNSKGLVERQTHGQIGFGWGQTILHRHGILKAYLQAFSADRLPGPDLGLRFDAQTFGLLLETGSRRVKLEALLKF